MNENLIQLLKKEIEIKVGKKILTGKDCTQLAEKVYAETKQQISITTLKRFFEVVKSDFNFSKFTTEVLVQFIGYQSLNDFRKAYTDSKLDYSNENSWEIFKIKVKNITEKSLKSMKAKTQYKQENLIFRDFVQKKFEQFAKSDKTATLFTAPSGWGKTTLLIQLAEKYFRKENALNNDDILLLINGKIFFNLYAQNPENEFLNQFLDFKLLSSHAFYFFKNPEQRKGRIWVFIDDVDDIFFDTESYHHFLENLMRMIMAHNYGWFKFVITCRPENLNVFSYLADKYPLIENLWFDLNFKKTDNYQNSVNVPLLSRQEINQILKINDISYEYSNFHGQSTTSTELVNQPDFLSLYMHEIKHSGNLSTIVLLSNFLQARIYSSPYKNEKLKIINRFIELCNRGKEIDFVRKDQLLSKADTANAYRELLSFGILYEYTSPNEYMEETTWVRFGNSIIFNFFLMEKWFTGREMNIELYNAIRKYYKDNIPLQKNMVKLFFGFLAYQNKHELIKKLRLVSALGQAE